MVITGYIDRYAPAITPADHAIRVIGRGACSDLVDCSALVNSQQIMGKKLFDVAKMLAKPHDIEVRQVASGASPIPGISDGAVPLVGIQLTQTPYEIIETIARWLGLLLYEDTDGALIIGTAGTSRMASGVKTSVNVQGAQTLFAMDQRYSDTIAVPIAINSFLQLHPGMPAPNPYSGPQLKTVNDPTMTALRTIKGNDRYRPMVIVSEQSYDGADIAKLRADWEVARRAGRGQVVNVLVDNWRDSSGNLWTPNALIAVDLPELKITGATWLIAEAVFSRDLANGTTALLTLMPPEAFTAAPPPYGIDWAVVEAARQGGQRTGQ